MASHPFGFCICKLLHPVAFICLPEVILTGEDGIAAALTFAVFSLVIYPILCVPEQCSCKMADFGVLYCYTAPDDVK